MVIYGGVSFFRELHNRNYHHLFYWQNCWGRVETVEDRFMRHLLRHLFLCYFYQHCRGFVTGRKNNFAGLITWLAFGKGLLKRMVFNAILFLIVTFLYGGITIALLTAFSWEGITAAEGLYMPHITYLTVTSAAIAGMLIVLLTVSLIKAKRQEEKKCRRDDCLYGGISNGTWKGL